MQRLSPGDNAISSATWNKFADVSKSVIQAPPLTNIKGSRGASALRIQIENTTGDDIITDFPILEVGQPVYTPVDRDTVIYDPMQFVGTTPDTHTPIGEIAIVQGPILDSQYRPAVTRGPSWATIQFTDAEHECALPFADNTKLTSAASGIRILWHDDLPDTLPGDVKALVWLDSDVPATFIRGASVGAAAPDQGYIQVTDPTPLGTSRGPTGDVYIWKGLRTLGTVEYTAGGLSWWNVEPGEIVIAAYCPGVHTEGEGEDAITYDWIWIPNNRGYFVANCGALTAGPITNPGVSSGSGELYYYPHGSASDGSDANPVSLGTVAIDNPFPYAFAGGWHVVDFMNDGIGAPAFFGLTGHDLTGLPSFDAETQQVFWHDEGDGPSWTDMSDFASTVLEVGGGGGGGGDTVAEGYAIDVSGSGTVTVSLDPTEITGFATTAGTMQFFQHLPGDTNPSDPSWKTASSYAASPTSDNPQLLVNTSSGWKWTTTSSYDATKTMLLGEVSGTWQWKTLKDWLNSHLTIELVLDGAGHHLTVNLKCDGTTISTSSVGTVDCGDS